jgi:hypothetical protein
MHALSLITPSFYNNHKMVKEKDMKTALQEVVNTKKPNLTDIVNRNNVNRTTLSKRFRLKTRSRAENVSYNKKLLTDTQEALLLNIINYLSNKGLHPTPIIIKNLIEEAIKKLISKS